MPAEELRQRTKAFAIRVVKLYGALPKTIEAQVIGKQMLRCGTSIGANYRAACRSRSRAEFISKLGIVVEEADETIYWLELLSDTGTLGAGRLGEMLKEAHELTAIFTAARHTSRKT